MCVWGGETTILLHLTVHLYYAYDVVIRIFNCIVIACSYQLVILYSLSVNTILFVFSVHLPLCDSGRRLFVTFF